MVETTTDGQGAMDERDDRLNIRDLADMAGTTVRTIHYYIAEGLLPPPQGVKRNASYTGAHLARLRLIAALREEGLALAAIRSRLAPLTDEQAISMVATLDAHLAAGDRAITILGLIEAALSREAASSADDLHEVPDEFTTMDVEPVQSMRMPEPTTAPPPDSLQRRAPLLPRRLKHVPDSPAPDAALDDVSSNSASDYLGRLLRQPPGKRPAPPRPAPAPMPRPAPAPMPIPKPRPTPDPFTNLRPETWHHFEIADGIELRVRDDRYRDGRGGLHAVIDSLRPILHRYGLTQRQPDDDTDTD